MRRLWGFGVYGAVTCALAACVSPAPQPPVEDEQLLQDFLEYLLEFETETGEWVDPGNMEEDVEEIVRETELDDPDNGQAPRSD